MKRLAVSKRAHLRVLRVELVEVGDSLREVLDGHVVAVLVLPLGSPGRDEPARSRILARNSTFAYTDHSMATGKSEFIFIFTWNLLSGTIPIMAQPIEGESS